MSWYQLVSVFNQAQQEFDSYVSRPPTACPNDGEPLRTGPDGALFCTFDGWAYPRDYIRPETA